MITGILFEATAKGEGRAWCSTHEGAYAWLARRKSPVSVQVLYLSRVARIAAGDMLWEAR